jgi:hypothetical protein
MGKRITNENDFNNIFGASWSVKIIYLLIIITKIIQILYLMCI